MHQRDALELGQNITQLRRVGFQKLTTGRHIEEEVLDREVTAFGAGNCFLALDFRSGNDQTGTQFFVGRPGLQLYFRNRSKRLATKAHGAQRKQISRLTDFGSGMTLKGKTCIRFGHTFSVVNHLNASLACIRH